MLVYPLPKPSTGKVFVFTTNNDRWMAWNKPSCSMVSAILIGSGGGGGGGFTGAAGTARGGGGGGGSSSITRCVWPAWVVPDVLFVSVAYGGAGGTASNSGSIGQPSHLGISASNTAANLWATTNSGAGTGGAGTGSAGGAGGSAGAAATNSAAIGHNWGVFTAVAGQAGTAGGAQTGAAGTAVTMAANAPLTGGAGGGGTPIANTDFAGGAITGTGIFPTLAGGVAAAGAGNNGYIYQLNQTLLATRELAPYAVAFGGMNYGGTGGGTAGASGTAGAGGRGGGYGTGGGGGGGGVTGGAGGKGGDGLIVIVCW